MNARHALTTPPLVVHLRPPVELTSRRDWREGRAYCGRRHGDLTSDRSLVTCLDCQAAHDADNEAAGR